MLVIKIYEKEEELFTKNRKIAELESEYQKIGSINKNLSHEIKLHQPWKGNTNLKI